MYEHLLTLRSLHVVVTQGRQIRSELGNDSDTDAIPRDDLKNPDVLSEIHAAMLFRRESDVALFMYESGSNSGICI
jgi:hypothetical protein